MRRSVSRGVLNWIGRNVTRVALSRGVKYYIIWRRIRLMKRSDEHSSNGNNRRTLTGISRRRAAGWPIALYFYSQLRGAGKLLL
jgi:hypothetical protein